MAHKIFESFDEFVNERALPKEVGNKALEAGFVEPNDMVKDHIKTTTDYSKTYYTYPTGNDHRGALIALAKKRHNFAGFAFKWQGASKISPPLMILDSPEKVDAILNNLDSIIKDLQNGEFEGSGRSPDINQIADKYLN